MSDYVLQRALTVVESEQKDALISKIRPQLATMRRYSSAYSKHLISSEFFLPSIGSSSYPFYVVERLLEKTSPTQGGESTRDAESDATQA